VFTAASPSPPLPMHPAPSSPSPPPESERILAARQWPQCGVATACHAGAPTASGDGFPNGGAQPASSSGGQSGPCGRHAATRGAVVASRSVVTAQCTG
jgi:hypothetical protein